MLTVDDALQLVLQHSSPRAPAAIPLADALGLTLAEDVASDIDSPPYDKSLMDGFALRAADLVDGPGELQVLEEIMAGAVPTMSVVAGTCSRIMTGAPLPDGADAVVMQERTEMIEPRRVRIDDRRCRTGQNILRRATSLQRGDVVIKAGRLIRPVDIGLLAEVGRVEVSAIPPIRVAVISTGNELVAAGKPIGDGQIRNSNGPMLAAAVRRVEAEPVDLGIVRDEVEPLRSRLAEGLLCDVLLISGGVSTGVLDLVPGMLAELGVEEVFHKIRMKPGKPLWFGVKRRGSTHETLVFGLPGNPVSSFVCFELFAKPAIARLAGREAAVRRRMVAAQLGGVFAHRGDRPTYHPAIIEWAEPAGSATATPLPWAGSADLRGLADANALIVFSAGDRVYASGEAVDVLSLDD